MDLYDFEKLLLLAFGAELAPFLGPLVKKDFFLPVACFHYFNQPIAPYHQPSRSARQAYQQR